MTSQTYLDRRMKWKQYAIEKLGGKCIHCGITDHRVLEFDHKYPKEKRYLISALIGYTEPQPYLDMELELCQLLCSNCHILKTLENKDHICRGARKVTNKLYYNKKKQFRKARYKAFKNTLTLVEVLGLRTMKDGTGCWLYGQNHLNQEKRVSWKRGRYDVRLAGWQVKTGEWVEGRSGVVQTCGKKHCWNPEHLEIKL